MRYDWDPAKAAGNLAKHGVAFEAVEAFDWDAAVTRRDPREYGGEARYQSRGPIDGRLHTCVFTMRGETVRVISLWKSNNREIRRYMEARNVQDQNE